jgi:hypothetical protein
MFAHRTGGIESQSAVRRKACRRANDSAGRVAGRRQFIDAICAILARDFVVAMQSEKAAESATSNTPRIVAAMDIRFACPHCNQSLTVEERGVGMQVKCPSCNEEIEIPRTAAVPPPIPISPPPLPPEVDHRSDPVEREAVGDFRTTTARKVKFIVRWTVGIIVNFVALSYTHSALIATIVAAVVFWLTKAVLSLWTTPADELYDAMRSGQPERIKAATALCSAANKGDEEAKKAAIDALARAIREGK